MGTANEAGEREGKCHLAKLRLVVMMVVVVILSVEFGVELLAFLGLLLRFVAMILKPDLHLRGSQLKNVGEILSLRCTEILLLLEASLQLVDLPLIEQYASFAFLRGERKLTVGGFHHRVLLVVPVDRGGEGGIVRCRRRANEVSRHYKQTDR